MAELPDLHHKMSKKIAQLTKVIFHLNTKCDEAGLYHQAQAEAYEKEIERIVKEANNIISRQKEVLEKSKQGGDLQAMVASIQSQYDEAKNKAQTDLAIVKSRSEERENQIKKDAKEQIDYLKREVMDIKATFQKQIAQFEGKQLTSASSLDDLKRAHQAELDAYVKEQNAKYSKLLQEKLDSEDRLKEELAFRLKKMNDDWEAKWKKSNEEWEKKLKDAVLKVKEEEKAKYQKIFDQSVKSI